MDEACGLVVASVTVSMEPVKMLARILDGSCCLNMVIGPHCGAHSLQWRVVYIFRLQWFGVYAVYTIGTVCIMVLTATVQRHS